jgi:hypothetical protein
MPNGSPSSARTSSLLVVFVVKEFDGKCRRPFPSPGGQHDERRNIVNSIGFSVNSIGVRTMMS